MLAARPALPIVASVAAALAASAAVGALAFGQWSPRPPVVPARALEDCETAERTHSDLAAAHLRVLNVAGARREMDLLARCNHPPSLTRMFVLADLQRSLPGKEDEAALQRGISSARAELTLGPGEQALITHLWGRAAISHDHAQGERLLYQAIAESRPLADVNLAAARARLYSYTALILDAGRRGEYAGAVRLFVEEGRWPAPPPCSLWLAADGERLLVVSLDPDGRVLGWYDGARRVPATEDRAFVPPELLAEVRGCAEVKVIALPPLEGRPDLLPLDLWNR